jgi:hypothetical protein
LNDQAEAKLIVVCPLLFCIAENGEVCNVDNIPTMTPKLPIAGQKRKFKRRHNQPAFLRGKQKTRRSGFFKDHSDILSAAFQAMVDHP